MRLRDFILAHAIILGFLWGLAEGTFFFVIPDVLITFVALFSWRRSLACMGATLAGSLLGGSIVYLLASANPAAASALVHAVPFIPESMFEAARRLFETHGALGHFYGTTSGIPYKLFASLAPPFSPLPVFLLASIPMRLGRFLFTWAGAMLAGHFLKTRMKMAGRPLMLVHAFCWVVIYVFYLAAVMM